MHEDTPTRNEEIGSFYFDQWLEQAKVFLNEEFLQAAIPDNGAIQHPRPMPFENARKTNPNPEYTKLCIFCENYCWIDINFVVRAVDPDSPTEFIFLCALLCLAYQQCTALSLNGRRLNTQPDNFMLEHGSVFSMEITTQAPIPNCNTRADFLIKYDFVNGDKELARIETDGKTHNSEAQKTKDKRFDKACEKAYPDAHIIRIKSSEIWTTLGNPFFAAYKPFFKKRKLRKDNLWVPHYAYYSPQVSLVSTPKKSCPKEIITTGKTLIKKFFKQLYKNER